MAEAEAHALNYVHPAEGLCIMADVGAGVQFSLDCTQFHDKGVAVRIFNLAATGAGVLGYKFSSSSTASISVGATSGPTACSRVGVNQSERCVIPKGQPYLHLQCPTATKVYVSEASDMR